MPLFSFSLVVVAAFIHATCNLLSERARQEDPPSSLFTVWVRTHHEQNWFLWAICCTLLSFSPGLAGPAVHETLLFYGVVGIEVDFHLVRLSPILSWTRGSWS